MGRPANQPQFFHKSAPRREGLIPIDLLKALFAACCFWKVITAGRPFLSFEDILFRIIGIKDNRRGMRACFRFMSRKSFFCFLHTWEKCRSIKFGRL
ncbi:hypothetical protein CEXT_267541 [Caerostris extrusa]|uniref:Uncharacterized protein n=1 Tax=Caerostris extrusa TaxID=172846 RepID=A0AAV4QBM0_CAEEX|nr:hypothetical protein CEXT_267541 [Caerostris extrusa]